MKHIALIIKTSILAAFISGCAAGPELKNMSQADIEAQQKKELIDSISKNGFNGMSKIQRGTGEYGYVLQVDGADSNIEVVMVDDKADEFLKKRAKLQKESEAVDPNIYMKKELFDIAMGHMLRAQEFAYEGNMVRALSEIEQVLAISPASGQALALRGSVLLQLGKKEDAVAAWNSALAADPGLVDVKAQLESVR